MSDSEDYQAKNRFIPTPTERILVSNIEIEHPDSWVNRYLKQKEQLISQFDYKEVEERIMAAYMWPCSILVFKPKAKIKGKRRLEKKKGWRRYS